MKPGDVLTAINPCKMESSERATLTIGKKVDVDKGLWLLSQKQNVLLTSK